MRRDHVAIWVEDPAATGSQKLIPVTCSQVRHKLQDIIRDLYTGRELTEEQLKVCVMLADKEYDDALSEEHQGLAEEGGKRPARATDFPLAG